MKFEIFRCGTQFCWRLLDASNTLLCQGNRQRRSRSQIEEDILKLMDGVPNAELVDKTQVNARERTATELARTPAGKTRARKTPAAA